MPFAEAERVFRLVLANFGGEERRVCGTGWVFEKQRADGDAIAKI